MAQVVLENVCKIYPGDVRAVDDVNLIIADAEFLVLVGPSGCGKSTTLRMVAGLEDISQGTIRIGEQIVNDVAPKNRDIAMVFQNYALYPHMSVYRNMAFGLKLRKFPRSEIDERVKWAAKILDLEPLLERKPKALSGGQRQRVALGRAIVRQPAAFLFDEPLSNLDAKLRVETRAELKRLHHRLSTTTIYVTHDQEEAMTLGDRVAVMDQGRVQQVDAPLTVYHQPVNRFVAGFLGNPPMNFIEGVLQAEDGVLQFVGGGVGMALLPEHAAKAQLMADQKVVLGIRPEAMYLDPANAAHREAYLDATATVIEPLGSSMDLYAVTAGDMTLVARVAADSAIERDAQVRLYIDRTRTHLFEPGMHGRNLLLG